MLGRSGSSRRGEIQSVDVLKVEATGFADGFDVDFKRGLQDFWPKLEYIQLPFTV